MNHGEPATAPIFPDVSINLAKREDPVLARVVSNDSCMRGKSASFVNHLVLDISDTPMAGRLVAGQAFGVLAPGTDSQGRPHKIRLYSNASPGWGEDGAGTQISTTPKRLIDEVDADLTDALAARSLFLGVCSNYLCDLQVGDELRITGPSGKRFVLPENREAFNYLFLATGTGVAPFRGMLLELLTPPNGARVPSRIDLVMGTPYTTDLLYDELFQRLASEHENFHYHTAISREPQPGSDRGIYVDGLIEREFDTFAPALGDANTLMYVCGLESMRYSVARLLVRHQLGQQFFRIDEQLREKPFEAWSDADIRKYMKPGKRCYLEVY